MFVNTQTERFDQMSEHSPHPPASLVALIALCERMTVEAPHLRILGLCEYPKPFVRVKDTVHGIVVGFSSEDELVTYLRITARKGA